MRRPCIAGCVLLLAACAQNQRPPHGASSGAAMARDTIVGIVTEIGADPATWLTITPATGTFEGRLTGDSAAALRSVTGAQVWLLGRRQNEDFVVQSFVVRAVNGAPVDDGTVVRSAGGALELRLASGERRSLPADLERVLGSRVWVSREVPGRAPSFGVIRAR